MDEGVSSDFEQRFGNNNSKLRNLRRTVTQTQRSPEPVLAVQGQADVYYSNYQQNRKMSQINLSQRRLPKPELPPSKSELYQRHSIKYFHKVSNSTAATRSQDNILIKQPRVVYDDHYGIKNLLA